MFKPFVNKEDGSFNLTNLMKSYYHAQKSIGRDKVVIPNENSTPDEWNEFYQKALGVDPAPENYRIEFKDDKVPHFNEQLREQFRQKAHELRVPPDKAAQLAEFFNEQIDQSVKTLQGRTQEQVRQGVEKLQTDWGEAYDSRVNSAKRFIKEHGTDEFREYLKQTGLGQDPGVIKFFGDFAAKFYGEGKVPKEGSGTGEVLTPTEAKSRINEIMGDKKHPYHNAKDPRHKDAVREMTRLFEMKNA